MATGKKQRTRKQRTMALEMSVDGLSAPINVRKSARARRLTLSVNQTDHAVVLTMPNYCDLDEANEFVSEHIGWIRDRLSKLPEPVPFAHGVTVPVRGEMHELHFIGDGDGLAPIRRGEPLVSIQDGLSAECQETQQFQSHPPHRSAIGFQPALMLEPAPEATSAIPRISVRGKFEHAPRRFRDWLYAEAKKDLSEQVAFHAGRLGLKAKRISVKDQATRWGSCSTTGTLSFSWRLIFAPPHVLDYVAAHEVAHLAEMNHGPNFWRLVKQTCPEMDHSRDWLTERGSELHRYGAGSR